MHCNHHLVDPEFAPFLQWASTLAWRLALIGWAYLLLTLVMAQFGSIVGPAGIQMVDTVVENGWLLFCLMTVLSVLALLAKRLVPEVC